MKVQIVYRVFGYNPSDAFHRDPKFNKRTFIVDTKDLGTECLEDITEVAKETAPDGYELYECRSIS